MLGLFKRIKLLIEGTYPVRITRVRITREMFQGLRRQNLPGLSLVDSTCVDRFQGPHLELPNSYEGTWGYSRCSSLSPSAEAKVRDSNAKVEPSRPLDAINIYRPRGSSQFPD